MRATLPTFLEHEQAPLEAARALFLPLPYEGSVSYTGGTAEAPRAILTASEQLETYEETLAWSPTLEIALRLLDPVEPESGEAPDDYVRRVAGRLREIRAAAPEALVIGLGGEHSVTPPLVEDCLAPGDTVVVIDAHPDLRESYEGSAHSHACASRRLHEAGFRLIQVGVGCASEAEARFAADRPEIE